MGGGGRGGISYTLISVFSTHLSLSIFFFFCVNNVDTKSLRRQQVRLFLCVFQCCSWGFRIEGRARSMPRRVRPYVSFGPISYEWSLAHLSPLRDDCLSIGKSSFGILFFFNVWFACGCTCWLYVYSTNPWRPPNNEITQGVVTGNAVKMWILTKGGCLQMCTETREHTHNLDGWCISWRSGLQRDPCWSLVSLFVSVGLKSTGPPQKADKDQSEAPVSFHWVWVATNADGRQSVLQRKDVSLWTFKWKYTFITCVCVWI